MNTIQKTQITFTDDELLIVSEALKCYNVKLNKVMDTLQPFDVTEELMPILEQTSKLMTTIKQFEQ